MSEANSYGVMFDPSSIEKAAKQVITDWYDAYINEAARVLGIPNDPGEPYFPPLAQGEILSLSEFDQDGRTYRSPTIIVVSPGMEGTPKREGAGIYRGTWLVGVGVLASVPFSHDRGGDVAKAMAMALRSMFLQNKDLGGLAGIDGLNWLGESYDDRQIPDDQTMSEAYLRFSVNVIGIADALTVPYRDGNPPVDPTDDPGPYDTAQTVSTTFSTH